MHPAHNDEESTKVTCTKYIYANTDAYSNNYLVEVQGIEEVVELLVLVALIQSNKNNQKVALQIRTRVWIVNKTAGKKTTPRYVIMLLCHIGK